ncbi:AAA family ATPase [Nostoc sp.]|uniref:AAA family ATPase n=1 Tax=Nostoc sp. TaxID=1180 RepID=UPI002FFCEA6B
MNTAVEPMGKLLNYRISEQLYAGSRTLVYRAIREADQLPVAIKLLLLEYPTFNELLLFRNQYTIAKNLDLPGIVRPYSLEPYRNSYALVMEDFGGISLRDWLNQKMANNQYTLTEFLDIAIALSNTLDGLYRHRVIHKDIKPANILINPETKQVKLIDFSIASLLPRETQKIHSPNVLEGTLAYLSPEQTGRMNRGIDYRSDYYSLGVTFYELLAGHLPFQSNDPMELVHCHIAKQPNQFKIQNSKFKNEEPIPQVLCEIVMKLMAKNAEERYQSALGLKLDLEKCLSQLQEIGSIKSFQLGERDICDRFIIPEKLYGRQGEVESLLDAFERVSQGSTEIILVAGFSGIGKTAVVNEVHKPIVRQRGYFIKGKFDQFQRNIPFSAFVQAFRDLIGQLLSETDAQFEQWKCKILSALGENRQVMIEVIPELERIIGKQPPAPELSGSAAQNRFNLLFLKFTQVFAALQHPLVIFIDDLQWADSASLKLMHLLMSELDIGYLLLIGAYRDNEVNPVHPLMLTLEEIQNLGATVNTITLASLDQISVNHLVADTLSCSQALAAPLTELVLSKTKGNPFFSTQFLKALHQDQLITFNCPQSPTPLTKGVQGGWECDIAQVRAIALTDDVVEFMAIQLQKLSAETQEVLKLAACVGNQFDLATLAIVREQSEATTADELWKALQEGLIIPTSDVYKFYQQHSLVNSHNDYGQITISYKFLHDRIQQAAYSLIPDNQKQVTHLHIGRLLQQATTANERDEKIFAIVNHLNQGVALINDDQEQQELVQLNLAAGHKAKGATAYAAALDYFNTGIAMLTSNCWHRQYNLALILYEGATESAYLCTDFEQMEQLAEIVLNHAQSWLDRVNIYSIKIQACMAQHQQLEALQLARKILKYLGVHLPERPTPADIEQALRHTQTSLNGRSIESLLELPSMSAPEKKAAMVILSSIISAAYQAAPDLLPLVIFAEFNLSVEYGNAPESTHGYVMYGLTLVAILGDIEAGYRFGQLGVNLLQRIHAPKLNAKTIFAFNCFLRHWQEPAKYTLEGYLQAYSTGLETGDIEYVALSLMCYCYTAYWSGQELSALRQTIEAHRQVIQQLRQDSCLYTQSIYHQVVVNLLEVAAEPERLLGEYCHEDEIIQLYLKTNHGAGLYQVYFEKLFLSYLFQHYEQALQNAKLAEPYLGAVTGLVLLPLFYFYDALVRLAVYPDARETDQISIIERVTAHQEKLSIWADHAPSNQAHRYALVVAEKCRILGTKAEAIEYYDRAIAKAKENEYVNEEALANELAAKFYLEWGKERIAQEYLINAYYCYTRWGAKAKVDDLEQRYPQLLAPILQQTPSLLTPNETVTNIDSVTTFHPSINRSVTSSSNTSVMLDLATVLKASQTLSSEIELDKLLTKLLQVVIENAGADKCALLLLKEDRLVVEATAQVGQQSKVLQSIFVEDSADVSHSLIYTVKRSLQPTVILDTTLHPVLIADPYISSQQPKSLLCTPILYQGKLLGILYLENNLITGAFTSDRIEILNLLCTQAAISLENARLYQQAQNTLENLGQTEQFLRLIIDNIPQSVFWKDRNSVYLGCNHKFAQTSGVGVPENIIGKTDYGLPWTREESDCYVECDRGIMESGQAELNIIETIQQVDGKQIWSNTNKIPLRDKEGNVFGILGTSEDITKYHQAQQLLQQQKQQLEQALQELQTMQLQLVQGEKMSALGNLVAGVAHEINNPVGFIAGNIEPAKDYVKDLFGLINLYQEKFPNPGSDIQDEIDAIDLNYLREDLPKLLDSMKLGVSRIRSISTSLRTFSRADKDYKVPFDIHEGIDSTILILRHRLKANENRPAIEIVKNYGKLPLVECFAGQLNQVFMNLLANAIDALEQYNTERSLEVILANPNRITIQTRVADSGQHVLIKIADNGVGMLLEVKQKVFDHLFTTKPVGKGTGLGLAIAHQIVVKAHGGSLYCTSEVGKGTEFVIQISTQQQE